MRKKIVSIILFNEGNKILVQNRKSWDKYGYHYGFFGGKIEKGENPEQTLKREIKEELNINLKNIKFVKHAKKKIPGKKLEIEYYLHTASLPDMNKIECNEGEPFLTNFKTALTLKFNPVDLEILNELCNNKK